LFKRTKKSKKRMIESIEFEEGIFNSVFFELDKAWNDLAIRFIFLYGGSSSSKSFSTVQKVILYMLEDAGNNSLIFRKFSTDIDNSIFEDFKRIISDWELNDYFKIQKHYIECKLTGSFAVFKGLDDSEKIKGLSGFKKIIMEEFNQFDFADFKQAKKRLRGMTGQQIIGIFNPVSEMSFIKLDIFDNEIFTDLPSNIQSKQINATGDTIVLRTCYLDNIWIVGDGKGGGFIDKHVIADFERDRLTDINYYNIYALGHWGKLRTGGEFLKQFKTEKHVGNYTYNENLPLHISFDENVLPYLTCNVFQVDNGNIRQIDEIMLKDPLNTLKDTCEEFMKRYSNNAHGLFVYGDATSRKQDTKLQKGQNFYLLIKGYLSKLKPIFRVPKANPSVLMSRNFTNDLLAGQIEGVTFGVDSTCRNSINDYQYCTEDEEGKVNKKVIRDKITGQSYQEFGHASDVLRYILTAMFIDKYKRFMRG
jgi:phage terminase large subunit